MYECLSKMAVRTWVLRPSEGFVRFSCWIEVEPRELPHPLPAACTAAKFDACDGPADKQCASSSLSSLSWSLVRDLEATSRCSPCVNTAFWLLLFS